jgi:hypothetical protein
LMLLYPTSQPDMPAAGCGSAGAGATWQLGPQPGYYWLAIATLGASAACSMED